MTIEQRVSLTEGTERYTHFEYLINVPMYCSFISTLLSVLKNIGSFVITDEDAMHFFEFCLGGAESTLYFKRKKRTTMVHYYILSEGFMLSILR